MEKDIINMQMEMFLKVFGNMGLEMEKEPLKGLMELLK